MVWPIGLTVLAHLPRSRSEGHRESRAVLSREGSGEATSVAPPYAARAPPLWGVAGEARLSGAGTVNPGAKAYWLRRQVHLLSDLHLKHGLSTLTPK